MWCLFIGSIPITDRSVSVMPFVLTVPHLPSGGEASQNIRESQGAICKPDIRYRVSGLESSGAEDGSSVQLQRHTRTHHPSPGTSQFQLILRRDSGVGSHGGLCPRRRPACSGSSAMPREEPLRPYRTAGVSRSQTFR